MKKTLTLAFLLFIFAQLCFSQNIKRGLVLNGGSGYLRDVATAYGETDWGESRLRYNAGLGYKVRLYNLKKPFFYDFDLSVGMKKYSYEYMMNTKGDTELIPFHFSGDINLFYAAFQAAVNYKIYRNLFLGVGLEPTVYLRGSLIRFDSPVTFRIGYDHKLLGWAFAYKHGLSSDALSGGDISKGKINEIMIQLFIPFR